MNQTITLTLLAGEVEDILKVLGNLPTNSGAFPLLMKINVQLQAQTQEAESEVPVE